MVAKSEAKKDLKAMKKRLRERKKALKDPEKLAEAKRKEALVDLERRKRMNERLPNWVNEVKLSDLEE